MSSTLYIYSVRQQKATLNYPNYYFRYSSIFFTKIVRCYFRHNLVLLLLILSSHLSLLSRLVAQL